MQALIGKIFVLFFVPLIWMPVNCGSTPHEKKEPENKRDLEKKTGDSQNPYFPLSTGTEWEYINEAPRKETITYKVGIVKNEGNNFEFNSFPFFSKEERPARLKIKTSGDVYLIDSDSIENLLLPGTENLKKDFSWEFGQWRGNVSSTNETVKTEYGTFENCIYLSFSIYFTFSAELWLAKDAGIVKWGYNRTNPPTLKPDYFVLTKMNINK